MTVAIPRQSGSNLFFTTFYDGPLMLALDEKKPGATVVWKDLAPLVLHLDQAVTKERARWASGVIVRNGDRLFVNNDRGELIILKPSPDGYHEISRTQLIKPTSPPQNRRELVDVNWLYPAYANKHIYARNDQEIISASLAADGR